MYALKHNTTMVILKNTHHTCINLKGYIVIPFIVSNRGKKIIFTMKKGKFLSFIISPNGIMIDLERVASIKKIVPPHNKR